MHPISLSKSQSFFSHLFGIFLLILLFVQSPQALDTVLLSRFMAVNVFLMVTVGALLFHKERWFTLTPVHLLLLVLVLIYAVSFFQSVIIPESWNTMVKLITAVLVWFVARHLFDGDELQLHILSRYVIGFCLLSDVMVMTEIAEIKQNISLSGEGLYQLMTPFAHKNLFSSAQICCIPFLLYACLFDKKVWRYLSLLAFLLWMTLVFVIQTKSVLLGVIIGLLFVGLLAFFSRINGKKYVLLTAGVLLIAASGLFALAQLNSEYFALLFRSNTFTERLLLWQNTTAMIQDHWLLGVGAGNWQIYFPNYGLGQFMQTNYLISDGYTTFQRPHNDFLWVFAESGLIGFLSYLLFFVYLIIGSVRMFMQKQNRERWLWLGAFFALIIYMVNAGFDFPLERNEHQFLLMLLAAFIASRATLPKFFPIWSKSIPTKMIWVGVMVCCVFHLYVGYARLKGETHAKKMMVAHKQGNWTTMIAHANKAMNSWYSIDNFSIPIHWYIGVAKFAKGDLPAAKIHFEQAYQLNPYQIHVLNNYAALFEKEGNHQEAIRYYDELLRISPQSPDGIINKSGALFNSGRYKEAFETIITFKWDENNTQFQTFLVAIVSAYLEIKLPNEKDPQKAALMRQMLSDELVIKKMYKESSEKGISFAKLFNE